MGRRREKDIMTTKWSKSHTLPSSPTHSSSSSDFEFTISLSPRKSSTASAPADELFYKGQLLPLHLSPRLSMVRHLLLSSSSTSSSATTTTASRDSSGSSTDSHSSLTTLLLLLPSGDCDSSRPSSAAAEDDEFKRPLNNHHHHQIKKPKYFSFSRFSSVFRKDPKTRDPDTLPGSSAKRVSVTAKDVIRKYLKKVKPLYEKLSSSSSSQKHPKIPTNFPSFIDNSSKTMDLQIQNNKQEIIGSVHSHSFSGNLRYPRRRSCVSSCPSSMRSSPTHSGVLSRNGFSGGGANRSDASSMEELQSAIQGAIAHCKNSMIQNNKSTILSNEI